MALSNWDTLAFDDQGQSCNGVFTHKETGASLEIYKNWVYLRDPKTWVDGRQFIEPTIAEIQSGNIRICGFDITAARHELQNSVFVFAKYALFDKEKEEGKQFEHHYFAGIGCYGYLDTTSIYLERLGITPKDSDYWSTGITSDANGDVYTVLHNVTTAQRVRIPPELEISLEDRWQGVSKETLTAFYDWLTTHISEYAENEKSWLEKIKAASPLRFNQGDAYFANHLGTDLGATLVGDQQAPVLTHLIKGMQQKES